MPQDAKKSYQSGTGLTIPTPTKKGYTFVGWYTKADFSGSKINEIKPWETKNFTLYAKWKKSGGK